MGALGLVYSAAMTSVSSPNAEAGEGECGEGVPEWRYQSLCPQVERGCMNDKTVRLESLSLYSIFNMYSIPRNLMPSTHLVYSVPLSGALWVQRPLFAAMGELRWLACFS